MQQPNPGLDEGTLVKPDILSVGKAQQVILFLPSTVEIGAGKRLDRMTQCKPQSRNARMACTLKVPNQAKFTRSESNFESLSRQRHPLLCNDIDVPSSCERKQLLGEVDSTRWMAMLRIVPWPCP